MFLPKRILRSENIFHRTKHNNFIYKKNANIIQFSESTISLIEKQKVRPREFIGSRDR